MKSIIVALLLSLTTVVNIFASSKATLNRTWVEAGVLRQGAEGLSIHVDFDITEAKGRLVGVQAIFYSRPGGWALRDTNDKYRLSPSLNYVASIEYFRPTEQRAKMNDFQLYIPVEELHLKGGHKYRIYAQLSLYADPGMHGEFLAESDFLPITIDLTDANHPKAVPDYSAHITTAEVAQAKKEGKQLGLITTTGGKKNNGGKAQNGKNSGKKSGKGKASDKGSRSGSSAEGRWASYGSKVEKDSIDRATFWQKEEVDSTALPKIYIE
jgi:hypothetical protein